MQEYNCPNCGAPLVFRSSVSVHTTCTYCRSMVVRRDMNLETIGKVAELLRDMSPFQVGTTGSYNGRNFTLIGRVKVIYSAGTWSEWVALFDDGSHGWLAEAQGNYMMTFEVDPSEFQMMGQTAPLETAKIQGKEFYIEDVKGVKYAASEGELPMPFVPGETASSIDLRSVDGAFASLTIRGQARTVFLGEYVPFERFNFQNLRTFDGF